MGYTMRGIISREVEDFHTVEIGLDAFHLISNSDIQIVGPSSNNLSDPEFEDSYLAYNGAPLFGEIGDTFRYPPRERTKLGSIFLFCKTGRLPYSEVVGATLLVIKHYLGEQIVIGSDDDCSDTLEWRKAIALYRRSFPDREVPVIE